MLWQPASAAHASVAATANDWLPFIDFSLSIVSRDID
jgi:hypothetical protein